MSDIGLMVRSHGPCHWQLWVRGGCLSCCLAVSFVMEVFVSFVGMGYQLTIGHGGKVQV